MNALKREINFLLIVSLECVGNNLVLCYILYEYQKENKYFLDLPAVVPCPEYGFRELKENISRLLYYCEEHFLNDYLITRYTRYFYKKPVRKKLAPARPKIKKLRRLSPKNLRMFLEKWVRNFFWSLMQKLPNYNKEDNLKKLEG